MKLHSGDAIDLKQYEPAMRHLIDTYIRAEESEKVSAFDDLSLIELIVQRGADAIQAMPEGIRKNKEAVAEAIENNVRKLIIDESPINPKYYEKMSELLDALIKQRRQEAIDYAEYLRRVVELTKRAKYPGTGSVYPAPVNTPAKRALYDNLGKDENLALDVDAAVRAKAQDGWRANAFKVKAVRNAIKDVLEASCVVREVSPDSSELAESDEERLDRILELVKQQNEY